MNTPAFRALRPRILATGLATLALLAVASPARGEIVAVATRVFHGYTRTQLPDGSYKPETYAFADGGCWGGGLVAGDSIAQTPFRYLAGALAVPMTKRGYVSAKDPANTDLLIFVFWGTTNNTKMRMDSPITRNLQFAMEQMRTVADAGAGEKNAMGNQMETYFIAAAAEQRLRERQDIRKAMLLGFQDDLNKAWDLSHTDFMDDYWDDLRADRYFVVLKAFDYRLAAGKEHLRKILWEARFSVPRESKDFIDLLPAMTRYASQFFGQDTKGLVREPLPEVRVILGPLKTVELEPVSK
jgi:hypothetical protein